MNILEQIVSQKRKEVDSKREIYPFKLLEQSIYFKSPTVSLKEYLKRRDKVGIIAEFKRKSPSAGIINKYAPVERTSIGYMQSGASALSILTDNIFFGGTNTDLTIARKFNFCPILRKDFIIDEYQIVEAKSIGADAILLLACVLTREEIKTFSETARQLGLEVVVEIREKSEIDTIQFSVDIVGVNNRSLKTFETNVQRSFELANDIPDGFVKISESGISNASVIKQLKAIGYNGFLIGEAFMCQSRPEIACENLVKEITLGL